MAQPNIARRLKQLLKSRFCRAQFSLVRHDPSATFETGLTDSLTPSRPCRGILFIGRFGVKFPQYSLFRSVVRKLLLIFIGGITLLLLLLLLLFVIIICYYCFYYYRHFQMVVWHCVVGAVHPGGYPIPWCPACGTPGLPERGTKNAPTT